MPPAPTVDRIAIVGTTGSGKTTLARALAARLDAPCVELDALFWRAGWVQTPVEEFRAAALAATAGARWVVDGNYGGKLGTAVLDRATLVVWLDLPLRTTLTRLLRRTVTRIRSGEELFAGNRETLRGAFLSRESILLWGLRTHRLRRRRYGALLQRYPHVRLRSARDLGAWLARLEI